MWVYPGHLVGGFDFQTKIQNNREEIIYQHLAHRNNCCSGRFLGVF